MKPPGLLGTTGSIAAAFVDTPEAMRKVGQNTGNLVFQHAVNKLLVEEPTVIGRDIGWDPHEVNDQCGAIVVPSANFIREKANFTPMVQFLESTNLPLLFLGLGAQADDSNQKLRKLDRSVLRLIDLIRERSPVVSVRGEFTASVLENFKVKNIEITGCPSNFINPDDRFAERIAEQLNGSLESFICHAEEPWPKKTEKQRVERRLFNWAHSGSGVIVQQSVPAMQAYMRRKNPVVTTTQRSSFEESLRRALMPDQDLATFRNVMSTKVRSYFSVEQWLEDSARFDFSVGPRFHGNMVAFQAGTPALWITHDARTRELVATTGLPSMPLDRFLKSCPTVQSAWAQVRFDPIEYMNKRKSLWESFARVAELSGVALKRPIQ